MTGTGVSSAFKRTYHTIHLTKNAAREVVWKVLAEHLAPYVPAQAHVLELGAGYCYWINGVRAARKVAVDLWEEFPDYAAPDVEPVILDVSRELLGLGKSQFDVVMASNLLEHFEPGVASQIVADVAALLRPQGRFIVMQPNFRYAYRHYFDDYTHRSIFTEVSLSNLMRSHGFCIEKLCPRFMPYSMRDRGFLVRRWIVRLYLYSPIKPRAGQMLIVGQKSAKENP
jgi:SAM-dependent methyltransferase